MNIKYEIITDLSFKGNVELFSPLLLELHNAINAIDFSKVKKNVMNVSLVVNPDLTNKYINAGKIGDKIYFLCITPDDSELADSKVRSLLFKCGKFAIPKVQSFENLLFKIDLTNDNIAEINAVEKSSEENNDSDLTTFVATIPKYQLQDVVLSDAVRTQIDRALALIQNRDKIYSVWGFSKIDPNTKTIICFYGAAGTGKTMCAQGIASYLGKKIMIANYASIESKWVGEGAKNLNKIFVEAEQQDAVLFFDEADSFLSTFSCPGPVFLQFFS
jgi:SpoVK/Ycf46/Vps4 family AAA+-type ATPase